MCCSLLCRIVVVEELQQQVTQSSTQREEIIRLKQELQLLRRDLALSGTLNYQLQIRSVASLCCVFKKHVCTISGIQFYLCSLLLLILICAVAVCRHQNKNKCSC